MGWSLPDPRPSDPVLGDPASIAALAAALHRAAGELAQACEELSPELVESRRHRTRVKALQAQAAPLCESMERTGRRLTEHASELADAIGLARRLAERARSVGLCVDGPAISRDQGVRGIADPAEEAARDEALGRLQRVLDVIIVDLDSARDSVRDTLASERTRVRRR